MRLYELRRVARLYGKSCCANGTERAVSLAPATYALHTASMPPAGDVSIKYHCGVENGKSYRHHAAASHNNTLMKMCNDPKTTVADFNDHILAASSCLCQAGLQAASTRLTSAWMEIQSCLPVAPMISKYFSEYLRKYAGRFLPVLIDQLLRNNFYENTEKPGTKNATNTTG